jgi:hypothetical protein
MRSAPPPTHIYILCRDHGALQHITKIRSLDGQDHILTFHRALTSFCSFHRDTGITLVWSPVKRNRTQDSTARSAALEACAHSPRATISSVRSPSFQKKLARRRVSTLWSKEWHAERHSKLGRDHLAYDIAILRPPDGSNHPLWNAACKKDQSGFPPDYTRHTTTTALRLAVGHAFTGTYARRFRPDLPIESQRCPCGWFDRSDFHLIYECPRYASARRQTSQNLTWDNVPLDKFYGDVNYARLFLDFLQISRAAFKPESGSEVPFEPG